jgi:nitroimidazol reductase NimA-like FMN-containing flavoprotein (pyridoxamine 5'-phosphate oxidase superfamily)
MTSGTGETVAALDTQTCWQLLAGEEVGRLAVSAGQHPDMFPVNYAVDEETIVFRTAEGTKLFALFVDSAVAFEVDSFDAETGTAWSVVIKGHGAEIPMHDLLDDLAFPSLYSWSATPKPRFVRVVPDEITGRRFHVVQRRPRATG